MSRPRQTPAQTLHREVSRASHAQCAVYPRKLPALQILAVATKGRIPELLKLRNKLMAKSAFTFFRGAVPIMAYDLSHLPNSGVLCQLCGDAHVLNLGSYAVLEDKLIFDINDYDETICGPFEFDVKRLATSIVLAGRESHIDEPQTHAAALVFLRTYRESIHTFAAEPIIQLARYQIHRRLKIVSKVLAKAERADPLRNLKRYTKPAKDHQTGISTRSFRSSPPNLRPLSGPEATKVIRSLKTYAGTLAPERRHFFNAYNPIAAASQVVGVGSVGLRVYCVYLEGNGPLDPLFLQIKEEPGSAWANYLPKPAHPILNQGLRVVEGQRAMQFQSDPFLGYTTIAGRDYLVRQLHDHKASINLATLGSDGLRQYAGLCGELLARGHARSGSPNQIADYLGKSDRFDKAVLAFATAYADQTKRDWQDLRRSMKLKP